MSGKDPNSKYGKMCQFEQNGETKTSKNENLISKIKDFYNESPLRFYIICGVIGVVLLIIIIVIIVIAVVASKKDKMPVILNGKNVDEGRVKAILKKFPARNKTSFEDWGKYLRKYADEYELNQETKVWLVYQWISENIYYKAGKTDPEGAYNNGYTDCVGFANLFGMGSYFIGFEEDDIMFIHGDARLVNSCTAEKPGDNHWWNAIKLNGTWNLVDQERRKDYFFLIYPEALIRDHLPRNATEQFLSKPITSQDFCDMARTTQVFGNCKFYKIEPDLNQINTNKVNGTIKYYYKNPTTDIQVTFIDKDRYVRKGYGNFTKFDDYFQINYFFPSNGTYYVRVSARPDILNYNYSYLTEQTIVVS